MRRFNYNSVFFLTLPERFFGTLAVMDICARAIPTHDLAAFIAEWLHSDKEPPPCSVVLANP